MSAEASVEQALESSAAGPLQAFCEAVSQDLFLLASLHDKEPDSQYLVALREIGIAGSLGFRLQSERGIQALEVFDRALLELPRPVDKQTLDELAADFAAIYLTHAIHASPEESVWINEDHLVCQENMFQVRSWYERYGLGAADWRKRPDDHLVLQLHFMSHLLSQTASTELLRDVAQFMDEHLLRWLMSFAERVASRCATPYFAGATMLTADYCEEMRNMLVEILGEERPSPEDIEKRMRPELPAEEVPVKYTPGIGPAV